MKTHKHEDLTYMAAEAWISKVIIFLLSPWNEYYLKFAIF